MIVYTILAINTAQESWHVNGCVFELAHVSLSQLQAQLCTLHSGRLFTVSWIRGLLKPHGTMQGKGPGKCQHHWIHSRMKEKLLNMFNLLYS